MKKKFNVAMAGVLATSMLLTACGGASGSKEPTSFER